MMLKNIFEHSDSVFNLAYFQRLQLASNGWYMYIP